MSPSRSQPASPFAASPIDRFRSFCLLGWTALATVAPLFPGEAAAEEGNLSVLALLWLLLLTAWLGGSVWFKETRFRIGSLEIAGAVFLLLAAVSAVAMGAAGHARPAYNLLWQWMGLGACVFLARQLLEHPARRKAVAAWLLAMTAGLSLYGAHQYFVSFPQMRAEFQQAPDRFFRLNGINPDADSPEKKLFTDRIESTEPFAMFALANSLAGFITPSWVLAVGLLLTVWKNQRSPRRNRQLPWITIDEIWAMLASGLLLATSTSQSSPGRNKQPSSWMTGGALLSLLAVLAAMSLCLILTKSRTGVLAASAGLLGVAWCSLPGKRLRWMAAGVSAAVLLLAVGAALGLGVWDKLVLSEAPKSLLYRWEYWQASWAMIGDFPWLGCGPGNFQTYYAAYKLPQASETVADPHNFLLEIGATMGAPAAVAFLAMLGAAGWSLFASRETEAFSEPATTWPVVAGAFAGLGLAAAIRLTNEIGPDAVVLSLCGLALAGVFFGLRSWIDQGAFPPYLPPIAGAALLVNLSASGGLGFWGVVQSGAVLLALVPVCRPAIQRPRWLGGAALAGALLVTAACYRTAFYPVALGQTQQRTAETAMQEGRREQARQAYSAAAEIDPYWAKPHLELARLHYVSWLQSRKPQRRKACEEALAEAISRHPRFLQAHRFHGNARLDFYRIEKDRDQLLQAIAAYSQWVKYYPNHSLAHAELAWTLHLAGDREEAIRHAEEALRLDRLHSHSERKLKVLRLHSAGGAFEENPEQQMERLRKS